VQNARSKSTDAADRPPPAEPRKSDATSVDEALIYGVMRTESAFQERVVSPARAVGLLQLLPETARSVAGRHPLTLGGDGGTAIGGTTNRDGGTATGGTTNRDGGGRQLGCAPSGDCVLTDAAVNIPLGVLYLQELAQTTKQSEVLSVASYNAGPDAVVRWARRLEKLPLDVWVEAIPFTETRAYVSRVLGARAHYTYLTGGLEAEPAFPFEMPHF
jgi:soluble lytic murein transglycosylase